MSDVLIRDVPADDLELIRSAARERGISLQAYLRQTVHSQAAYLRRQEALAAMSNRLSLRQQGNKATRTSGVRAPTALLMVAE